MNREVNLTKRVLTDKGVRYCPIAPRARNGRVRADVVIVEGKEEKHTEGAYYIEWWQGAKRCRLSVGKDAVEADASRQRKEAELNAINNGIALPVEAKTEGKKSLSQAVKDYLEDVELKEKVNKPGNHGRHGTHGVYSTALEYFQESCHKVNLEDVERRDLLKYSVFLREKKDQAPQSVYNKFQIVISFLKAQGITKLVLKTDWPKFTPKKPEIYEKKDLDGLFAACDEEEKLWFEFFLGTGFREQEVIFCYKKDVNVDQHTVSVSAKPELNWSPKAYQERTIPISDELAESLKIWMEKSNPDCPLLFPTSGCKPKKDFLDCLKKIAIRGNVSYTKNYWRLHRFRSTFGTWCDWGHLGLGTIQERMGHKDVESTMRYLRSSRGKETRNKVNAIFNWRSRTEW